MRAALCLVCTWAWQCPSERAGCKHTLCHEVRALRSRTASPRPRFPVVAGLAFFPLYAAGGGSIKRIPGHRDGCQCVICKQSRRSGSQAWAAPPPPPQQQQPQEQQQQGARGLAHTGSASALGGGGHAGDGTPATAAAAGTTTAAAAGAPLHAHAAPGADAAGSAAIQARLQRHEQQQQQKLRAAEGSGTWQQRPGGCGAGAGGPRFRDGKRAYLRALPQLASAGPTPHQVRS